MTGRPKPTVLFESTDERMTEEYILESQNLWIVMCRGQPFNLKREFQSKSTEYKPTVFHNPAYAFRLVERLNAKYKTLVFTVETLIKEK